MIVREFGVSYRRSQAATDLSEGVALALAILMERGIDLHHIDAAIDSAAVEIAALVDEGVERVKARIEDAATATLVSRVG